MSQHRLPGRISFLMALALAIGSTCAPRSRAPVRLHQLLTALVALPVTGGCL
jgi:hypothetical protein